MRFQSCSLKYVLILGNQIKRILIFIHVIQRSKYCQAFTNLNKAKDANTMVANALTKQIEKELTYIKQLNEREKNMNSHLVRTRKAYDDMNVVTKHVS